MEEGAGDTDEVRRLCASVLGETTEPAPEECRYYPGHADLRSFGGETEWDVVDVGLLHSDWQGRRGSQRVWRVVLGREGLAVAVAARYVADGRCQSSP